MKRIKLNHIFSMKIPLFLLFLIIGFLPVFIQSKFMNQSFSQTQIDGRMIEVQNQCLITGDRLTRAGYLLKENHDPLIDKELDTIADFQWTNRGGRSEFPDREGYVWAGRWEDQCVRTDRKMLPWGKCGVS